MVLWKASRCMQKECKISSDGTPEMHVWLCYSTPVPQTCHLIYCFMAGMILSERDHVTQRVFSAYQFLEALIAIPLQVCFVPSTHHQKAPQQGSSLLKLGIHSSSSFLLWQLSDHSKSRNVTFLQFALRQQPAGFSRAIPSCVPCCSTCEANNVFPRSKCSWCYTGKLRVSQQ